MAKKSVKKLFTPVFMKGFLVGIVLALIAVFAFNYYYQNNKSVSVPENLYHYPPIYCIPTLDKRCP